MTRRTSASVRRAGSRILIGIAGACAITLLSWLAPASAAEQPPDQLTDPAGKTTEPVHEARTGAGLPRTATATTTTRVAHPELPRTPVRRPAERGPVPPPAPQVTERAAEPSGGGSAPVGHPAHGSYLAPAHGTAAPFPARPLPPPMPLTVAAKPSPRPVEFIVEGRPGVSPD